MADIPTTGQQLAAEALGTFVLVFFGCGAVAYAGQAGGTEIVTIGLTFGLAVAVMAYAVGRISGGHFNPAVSVGAALSGRIAWGRAGLYVAAQLAGAILAAGVLWAILHGFEGFDAEGTMGQNAFGDAGTGYAWWAALILEALLTAVFLLVILGVTDERFEHPGLAPLAIGLTLAAIHFVAIPATGTSVNPARSIGPALFAGTEATGQLWLFILAPLLGAAVAGLTYSLLFGRGADPVPGSGLVFSRAAPAPAGVPGYGAPDQYQQQWNAQDSAYQAYGAAAAQQAYSGYAAGQASAGQPHQDQGPGRYPTEEGSRQDAIGAAPVPASVTGSGAHAVDPAQAAQQWPQEPIIENGWMWDAQAQQWVPAPPHLVPPEQR